MYSASESDATVVYKEPLLVYEDYLFIREAPIEENTWSEYIRTVAKTCACKI